MPIDKRQPRVLNSDADSKTLNKVSMEDALNLYSGPDNEGILADGSKSDSGDQILKNIKGNLKVSGSDSLPSDARLIGSVEDVKTDITYLFVYSGNASKQGVWAYDKHNKLPGDTILKLVYKSPQFKFPQNGFVKGDIVYSNAVATFSSFGDEFDKDAIIYFTDGVNEPRKINAYRAIAAGGEELYDDVYAEADFITACPKTPLFPITFSFGNDPSRSTSNFSTIAGFQFAYQNVYVDGVESAISPYSEVAFPPSVVLQGSNPFSDHSDFNVCNLKVPTVSGEIKSIKILAKQDVGGSFLIVDELFLDDASLDIDTDESVINYNFYNDRVGLGVSSDEVNKQFDSVPRRATAQAVSSNRLMYGNYLDGFDSVQTNCTHSVEYKDAPESFITYDIKVNPSIEPIGPAGQNSGKSAGFVFDFSEMPQTISEGTVLSLNTTIAPDRNWHLYNFKAGSAAAGSFQQTVQRGIQTQGVVDNEFNGVNFQQSFADIGDSGEGFFANGVANGAASGTGRYFGAGSGVAPETQGWSTKDITANFAVESSSPAMYGTSAANPLILKGGAISISVKIKATENITSDTIQKIKNAFDVSITSAEDSISSLGFELLERDLNTSYSFDVGLFSGQRIQQDRFRDTPSATDSIAKLITGVKTQNLSLTVPPGGYFIVNKAKVNLGIRKVDLGHYDGLFIPDSELHYRLKFESIEEVELFSCIHATTDDINEEHPLDWIAISREDLDTFSAGGGISDWLSGKGFDPNLKFHLTPFISGLGTADNIAKQIGYIQSPSDLVASVQGEIFDTDFCLMDGEGGPGGGFSNGSVSPVENSYDYWRLYNQGSVTVNARLNNGSYNYSQTVFYRGRIGTFVNDAFASSPYATTLPLLFREVDDNFGFYYPLPESSQSDNSIISAQSPNFKRLHSCAEIVSNNFFIFDVNDKDSRSFKTEANHDFGIVYYDERGRHGFVNPLTSVFVEGYTDAERGEGQNGKGRVEITLEINHAPPSWAHFYKIAYAKNSTVSDFIQYSAAGAFVSQDIENQEVSADNQNIYVSLNHLQGNDISYVSSFGARTPEGGLNMYKYQEGDKLRVISYFEGEDRKYESLEFDVVDLVKLGGIDDGNPLLALDGDSSPLNKQGDFVVLKNNPNAFGFSYGDVLSGISKWGDNCIVELRTPLKDVDADKRVFYELSETYPVVKIVGQGLSHGAVGGSTNVTLKNGDVWFRPVATNVREFESGQFVDLIGNDLGDDYVASSNFKNVYLESSTATDLFKADNLGLGRPNIVVKNAKETVRESTITYSDPSNPEGTKINYSSFNSSLANFKDLPERFGGIQYMGDRSDSILVIQKDKVSRIPVNRSILSDAGGNNTIIASRQVLNEAVFYYGQSGCDTDPSSVFDSGEEVYFCNKSFSKVYRFTTSNGIEEISSKGMSSMIRAALKRAIASDQKVRIVGGYDPLKEEYLLSILNLAPKEPFNEEDVDQPLFEPTIVVDGGDDVDEEDEDDAGEDDLFPVAEIDPGSLDFGVIDLESDNTSITREVIITNTGTIDLEIEAVSFEDPLIPVFKIISKPQFPIEPGQKDSILVEASSEKSGQFSNSLIIRTNELAEKSSNDIPLTLEAYITPSEPEEFMNAQEAIDYLISLKDAPPEEHPTFEQMSTLMAEASHAHFRADIGFGSVDDVPGGGGSPGNVGTADLLLFLGSFNYNYGINESFFEGSAVYASGSSLPTITEEEGGDVPDNSGGFPVPPLGVNFSSVTDAINALLAKGDMTAAQFHFLNTFINKKVSHDFSGDGVIGTNDLLDLLQFWGVTTLASDPAFNSSNPLDLTNQPGPLEGYSSSDILSWIIIDGSMTASEYWYLSSFVKDQVKCDINGDGIVGTVDHLSLLNEWTVVQEDNTFTPYNGEDTAFA
jgi:hypothetical protein